MVADEKERGDPFADEETRLQDEGALLEAAMQEDLQAADYARIADAYSRSSRFADALRMSESGLRLNPEAPALHIARSRARFGVGAFDDALGSARMAMQLDARDPEPVRLSGELLLALSRPDQAVALLEGALAAGLDPEHLQPLLDDARRAGADPPDFSDEVSSGTSSLEQSEGGGPSHASAHSDPDLTRRASACDALILATREQQDDRPMPWDELMHCWREHLQRRLEGARTLPEDSSGPFAGRAAGIEVEVTPLRDPLAEGMPPIPVSAS